MPGKDIEMNSIQEEWNLNLYVEVHSYANSKAMLIFDLVVLRKDLKPHLKFI